MGSFHDASDGGPIPQHALDSMPPNLRAMMDKHMAGPTARGYPAAFLDEASPPVEGLDYGRIASAPMSWMTFRSAKSPCYVRIGGLTSERGQAMNGKWGWAVKTIGKIADLTSTIDELTKAIIGTIGDFDAYQLPDAKGYTSMVRHLTGIDDDYRQQMRDQVLGTRSQSFTAFADVLDEVKDRGRVAVLGGAEAVAGAGLEAIKVL